MRVATFNLHAGVDGWGRPTGALEHAASLNADILICPETWRGDDGVDFFADLQSRLTMTGIFVPLARAERVTTGRAGATWQPRLAHFTGEHGLYFTEHRSLSPAQLTRRARSRSVEQGDWGLSLLTRYPIITIRAHALGRLPRERVRRTLIAADLDVNGRTITVLAIHGAHLSHGSFRQYRLVRTIADAIDPSRPVLLVGDFNSWRPPLRLFLPGWRTLARARTWPAHRPHSQIDHILGRGPWRTSASCASDGGSDHLALSADLELANY